MCSTERTISLLAFEDIHASPVGELLGPEQRQKTACELNAAILHSQCLEKEPRLPFLLKLMMWAQGQLDEKCTYPHITDLASGALVEPGGDMAMTH